jgi:chromate reductase, NAD(P)H dehydrogenase (quinone)
LHQVLTICGSLRASSYNRALMNALPALAPATIRFREAPPIEAIPHFNADVQQSAPMPRPVEAFVEAVRDANAVVIISPEYNWSIPGTLKNALDWTSKAPNQPFKKKPVALQSAATGPLGGSRMQYHLRMALTYLDAFIFSVPEVFVSFAASKFDPQTLVLSDEATKKSVAAQLTAFADYIEHVSRR